MNRILTLDRARAAIEVPLDITEADNPVTVGANGRYIGVKIAEVLCAEVDLHPTADTVEAVFWEQDMAVPAHKQLFVSGICIKMTSIVDAKINAYADGEQYSLTIYPTSQNLVGRAIFTNNTAQPARATIKLEATVKPEVRLIQDGKDVGPAILAKAIGSIVFDVRGV